MQMMRALIAIVAACGLVWAVQGAEAQPKQPGPLPKKQTTYPAWYPGRIMCNAQPNPKACIQQVCGGLKDKAQLQACVTGPALPQALAYCQGMAEPGRSQCLQHACYAGGPNKTKVTACLKQYAGKPKQADEKAVLAQAAKIGAQIKALQAQGQQACNALRANKTGYANCVNVLNGKSVKPGVAPKRPTN